VLPFGVDELGVSPESPRWNDTVEIRLKTIEPRGRVFLFYTFSYPWGIERSGWREFERKDNVYYTQLFIPESTIKIYLKVKGEYYLNVSCPLIPWKSIEVYAEDSIKASSKLNDTIPELIKKWSLELFKKDSAKTILKIERFMKKLELKKELTPSELFFLGWGYYVLNNPHKIFAIIEKLFEKLPCSGYIPQLINYLERKETQDQVQKMRIRFLKKNPYLTEAWKMLEFWRDYKIPTDIAFEGFKRWKEKEPLNPVVLYYIAFILNEKGKEDEALEYINEAINLDKKGLLF